MHSHRERLARLEARMRAPRTHHIPVVEVPWDVEADDYLATLPCPCGQPGCALQTFGLVVREGLDSEVWQREAQTYYSRQAQDA